MAGINVNTVKRVVPVIYCYSTPGVAYHEGWVKIGYSEQESDVRVAQQTQTANIHTVIEWTGNATYEGSNETFTDSDFHAYLAKRGVERMEPQPGDKRPPEWFRITPERAKQLFYEFRENHGDILLGDGEPAAIPYVLRAEQEQAVSRALAYFHAHEGGEFLWNCKPRFGKTLAAYDLCRRMGAVKILIVTNRPAIANSWYQDYERFLGPSSGYLFISNVDGLQGRKYVLTREKYLERVRRGTDNVKGFIEFVSLQDLKGSLYFGGWHDKLRELSAKDGGYEWDILIVDEAHEGVDTYKTDVAFDRIKRQAALHLSGTPFKAIANDKFPDEAIYNWTYADEQKRKRSYVPQAGEESPYAVLPRLSLYTYRMSDIARGKAERGIQLADDDVEEYAFDLNEFFATSESGRFTHDRDVDAFLDTLAYGERFPFSTPELRGELKHTFWLLNRVASAKALARKLRVHPVFKDYEVILAAGDGRLDDEAATQKSYDRVMQAIRTHERTITLSVGQLTTGVTIPEWTAVLMLSNMESPALYMQAAFRAQNPCLFHAPDGTQWRKTDAYVFDFDPARTLTIVEKFANDLIPATSGGAGDMESRKRNVRELLNFFPVYGEDDRGRMVELDAEAVLTVPRHIHAREVVDRGFMSNFLFANVSGIFGAPREVIDLINGMQAIEQPKALPPAGIDENTGRELNLNEQGEVEVPEEQVVGLASDVFGPKIYSEVDEKLSDLLGQVTESPEKDPKRRQAEELDQLRQVVKPVTDTMVDRTREQYGSELRKSTQSQLERQIRDTTDGVIQREYGEFAIKSRQLDHERDRRIAQAQAEQKPMSDITALEDEYARKRSEQFQQLKDTIREKAAGSEPLQKVAEAIVETVETEKNTRKRDDLEGRVRDHLRGFSRTIPAFLMAYGSESTTLANFDSLVPEDVFWEVTANPMTGRGVTLDEFRFLRDGGDYWDKDDNGVELHDDAHRHHFDGHLFDEVVFNDAVAEFMRRRAALADYFDPSTDGDIFDYIPPQRTNQIFTPKNVVRDMVDMLEQQNPGCFDDPDATFADLYMKSGQYVTEIVTRLYRNETMRRLFPDDGDRLRHIFAHQVYGCAPTQIIYRICRRYILGFAEGADGARTIDIPEDHIILFDTLPAAKNGMLGEELAGRFGL